MAGEDLKVLQEGELACPRGPGGGAGALLEASIWRDNQG